MPIAAVVADANVLLSAVVGKAALRVIEENRVAVHATRFNGDEVEEYLPLLAAKYDLPEDLVQLQWRLFGGAAPCLNLQPGEELLDGELASLSTDCSQLRRRASRPGRACSWKRSAR